MRPKKTMGAPAPAAPAAPTAPASLAPMCILNQKLYIMQNTNKKFCYPCLMAWSADVCLAGNDQLRQTSADHAIKPLALHTRHSKFLG